MVRKAGKVASEYKFRKRGGVILYLMAKEGDRKQDCLRWSLQIAFSFLLGTAYWSQSVVYDLNYIQKKSGLCLTTGSVNYQDIPIYFVFSSMLFFFISFFLSFSFFFVFCRKQTRIPVALWYNRAGTLSPPSQ